MAELLNLLDQDPTTLAALLAEEGEPTYRAAQILSGAYHRYAADFDAMTDLPTALRGRLAERLQVLAATEVARSESPDGTLKLLLRWPDGATTETVMIPSDRGRGRARRTVCLSIQVGCDVGCRFCASGIGGALRNLTVGEVMEQALRVQALLAEREEKLTNVVFMGMGEPLANYEVTVASVRRLSEPWALGLGRRRVTVSTIGLPKQIERLAFEDLQATLALSLHAPNDELRRELIPWARGIPLERLLAACRLYLERTGREVTFEYCLLAGVNDRAEHAVQLASLAKELRAHINLMLYNPVAELPYQRPKADAARGFLRRLREQGANAHLRHSRGLEADAACGQLRRRLA